MALARLFDPSSGRVVSTLRDGYRDRAGRGSDIREYMPLLHEAARSRPGARVLELGTRQGNSTLAFLAGVRESGGHVWSCDVSDCANDPEGMAPWALCPQWTFIRGDDTDPAVQARLPGEVNVLFIDTSHEYVHTVTECRAYIPRVAPGGVALFHDTHLHGWPGYNWDRDVPPVWAALDDWCAETGRTWEDTPGEYGLGVIRL